MTGDVLRVEHLNAGYGDTQVLWDVSLELHPGEIVAIIGSNGAANRHCSARSAAS